MVDPAGSLPPCPHCGKDHGETVLKCPDTDLNLPLRGRLLDGKFRLMRPIGKGGMAEVWLAVNTRVDRPVAIKLIRPEVARDDSLVGRFRAEARAAGRIGHRDICDILDSGISPIGPFIVMELLRGRSLGDVITRKGALPHGPVVAVVRQALQGLKAAHDVGIVHRDLKPENVFLHRGDRGQIVVKLMDFGVAKFTDGTGEVRTEHGALLGTPEYMAPEQFKGAVHADVRTDVWAIGAILYRALTGHNAFSGPTIAAILLAVASENPKPLRERAPDVPPGLATIISRCLAKRPEERYRDVTELSNVLARFDTGLDGAVEWLEEPPEPSTEEIANDLGAAASDAAEPEPEQEPEPEPTAAAELEPMGATVPREPPPPTPRRSSWGPIVFGTAVVALLGFLAVELVGARPQPEVTEPLATVEPTAPTESSAPTEPTAPSVPVEPTPTRTETPREPPPEDDEPILIPPDPTATTGSGTPPPPPEHEPTSTGPEIDPTLPPTSKPTDPSALIRAGIYVTPAKQAPESTHHWAKSYCDALARSRYLGVSGWHLANPAKAREFVGNKLVKKGRYWTSALHKGKALVLALPTGKKSSLSSHKRARALCVARAP